MHHRRPGASLALPVLFCLCALGLPAAAQRGTGLYVGPGRVLQAMPPRQLSLNAHVTQILFQPGGLSIAYVGVRDEDGRRTVTVRLVDARRREPASRTLFRATGDAPTADAQQPHVPGVDLIGWTPDARCLLVRQEDQVSYLAQYVSVDMGTEPFHLRPVPTPQPSGEDPALPQTAWSPDHRRLLMVGEDVRQDPSDGLRRATFVAEVYDPDHDRALPVTVAAGLTVWGWLDDGHLLLLRHPHARGETTAYLSHDLATGADAEVPRPRPWPPANASSLWFSPAAVPATPAPPGLSLETQPQTLTDAQRVAGTPANAIWVRRAGAPEALSAVAVGVTPGGADPQAAWSPTGTAAAFVAHGDLFVTDLVERPASPSEKLAAGEKLDCDEEREIITSHMKQVGLGILMYAQDNDEKFPPADGWHDAVYPYVKNEGMFNFAGVPVVYHAPANLSLASIDSPATTVLATSDTPCAHIVLYADGHVKDYDKEGKPFPPGPKQ